MRVGLLAAALLGLTAAATAAAEDFCDALAVPEVLDLECTLAPDGSTIVAGADTPLATLNRLRVRRLEGEVDDPAAWLEEQMSLDTSGLSDAVRAWAMHPDNPIKPEALQPSIEALVGALSALSGLSRQGCEAPVEKDEQRWTMRCSYDAGIGKGVIQLDLFTHVSPPVAVDARAASAQRTRQFAALVNGLRLK